MNYEWRSNYSLEFSRNMTDNKTYQNFSGYRWYSKSSVECDHPEKKPNEIAPMTL